MLEDFKSSAGKWKTSYIGDDGVKRLTKSYRIYNHMMCRCNVGGHYQRNQPTYIGCTVSDQFKDYQWFADWYTSQIGYEDSSDLDKDIVLKGNKVYCPELCVLVPSQLNKFLTDTRARRGAYPQGVSAFKQTGKFQSRISIDAHQYYIGVYNTPDEAHEAYASAKEAEARRWAKRLKDGEFNVDPRVIVAMENWTLH